MIEDEDGVSSLSDIWLNRPFHPGTLGPSSFSAYLAKTHKKLETSTEVEIFLPEESLFVTILGVVVLGLMKHGSSSCAAYLIERFLVLSTVTVCCGGTYG